MSRTEMVHSSRVEQFEMPLVGRMYRTKVPGGWLSWTRKGSSFVYVPDPSHEWELEEAAAHAQRVGGPLTVGDPKIFEKRD